MSTNVISIATRKRLGDKRNASLRGGVSKSWKVDVVNAVTPSPSYEMPIEIIAICSEELGCPEVVRVAILPCESASPRSLDNVVDHIAGNGGEAVFGWKITASPLFVRAEFHAIVTDGRGLLDVTPDTSGHHHYSCFAVDRMVPAMFDFLGRPGPSRFSLYRPAKRGDRIASAIAAMDRASLAVTGRRAAEADLAVADLVGLEIGEDRLEIALELYLECSDAFDLLTMRAIDGVVHTNFTTIDNLLRRKLALETIVQTEFDRCAIR